jgi:putative endonuclease
MFYVYLLKSKQDNKLYVGYTQDLRRRVAEHNDGLSRSTANRGPFELIYYEAFRGKSDAIKREKSIKQFKQGYTRLKQRLEESLKT